MPVILASILIAVVVAGGAGAVLTTMQQPVYETQPMAGVRVGDPGSNLVGPNWSGQPPRGGSRQEAQADGRRQ
ncbi:MAG: hypothetical protein M5U07_21870 [Xanthobacteraceae bacterium]|nr:hypothetical protein [Xanthobacteraceae bacterium]PWB66454.1 MAG: hypothetical protein C3F17_01435 [Bradyrhizobiaceae bacterium]